MGLDPFWSNLFRRRDDEKDALLEILSEVPLFGELNRWELRKLQGILHRRNMVPGEAIIREGERGVGMYIILSGEVQIVQKGEDGSSQSLATLGVGDYFGEQAHLDDAPRTASALATEPCKVVGFFRPDLLDLIESNPRMGLKVVMHLSQMISVRLRHTNRLLKETRLRARENESRNSQERADPETEVGTELGADVLTEDAS